MPRIRASSIAEHKTLTRDQILDAAAVLFRTYGYSDTSLGDIAASVGIGRTTLYEYFTDKDDLLASLVEDRIPGVIDDLIAEVPPSMDASQRLSELVVRGLDYISDEDNLGTLLMRETPRLGPEAQRRIRTVHGRLEDEILALCTEGVERGEFPAFDPKEAARLVFAVMWSASQALLRDEDAKQRRHEVSETVVRFVMGGLGGAESTSS